MSTPTIVSLSTALRDQPFTETDAQCTCSFNEITASAFRVLSCACPLSQYTFQETNRALKWQHLAPVNFLPGDYLDLEFAFWSSLGTFNGPFLYREIDEATGLDTYFKSGVIQFKFYNDINLIRSQVNPEAGSTAIGRIDYDAATNRMVIFMNPAPAGVTIRAVFECDSPQMLGFNSFLLSRRTGSAPTVPAIVAPYPVDLTAKPAATSFKTRWTPTPNVIYTAASIITELNAALVARLPTLPTSAFPYPWFTNFGGRVNLSDSNFSMKFTSSSPRIRAVTGIMDLTWVPTAFKNSEDSPSRTQVSPYQIDVSAVTYIYVDHVLNFSTMQLYTKEQIISALNDAFISYSVSWSTAESRFSLVNGESYDIRLGHNDVLGLRTPEWITVPKGTGYSSPYVMDLSGLTDTMSIGLPTLFHTGRTSQGSANAKHTRRRDVVLTLVNTGSIAFGSFLSFQSQDPTFISLGTTQSISSIRISLMDAIFNLIPTTHGQPIHLTLEFI